MTVSPIPARGEFPYPGRTVADDDLPPIRLPRFVSSEADAAQLIQIPCERLAIVHMDRGWFVFISEPWRQFMAASARKAKT